MSPTMLLGRVVFPGIALVLAGTLFWQALANVAPRGAPGTIPSGPRTQVRPLASTVSNRITAQGRVVAYPGGDVIVASEVLGTIVRMPAAEKTAVRKGDLIVELRADDVRASLREAEFRLVEAEAALRFEQERFRLDRIIPAFTNRDLRPPNMRHEMTAAIARRDAAQAVVERLEAETAKYHILAPIDGVVVARHADPGETIVAAAPLVTVVDLRRLRVEAEIDEFDIDRVAVGARATITAEGFRGRVWRGEVEEVADAVVGRRTLPEDPGRPTDTLVLPIRVTLPEATLLKLGQRVDVEINRPDRER